ncbi:MAG: hypothetical protein IJD22_00580 [Clostridia bacterium]|nr:hypothetical protein [Clostridia bacterium]
MKKIISVLLLAVLCASLFSCAAPEPVAMDILDGDGNAVATGYYDEDGKLLYEEKVNSKGEVIKKTTYDSEGRVEKVEEFMNGSVSGETVYTYGDSAGYYSTKQTVFNNKGVVVNVKESVYEQDLIVSQKRTFAVSDGVNDVEDSYFSYNDDGTVLETVNSNGRKVREKLTDGNGVLLTDHDFSSEESSFKTYYNEGDKIAKTDTYNAAGELVISLVYTYDENGKTVMTESYNKAGTRMDYSKYVYENDKIRAIYKYNDEDGLVGADEIDTINSTIMYDDEGKATVHKGVYVPIKAQGQ